MNSMEVGIDLVEFIEVENRDERFIKRILSEKEYLVYQEFKIQKRKTEYLASRFASKEAIFKAFKKGDLSLNFNDISILNDECNAPYIVIRNEIMNNLKISISHSKNYAVAIVIKED